MSKTEFIKANLKKGEIYVGAIGDPAGNLQHVILLPGDNDDASWQAQMDWAKSLGGELPDRVESALLFATMKDEFEPEWYWTREQYAADSGCAWGQDFFTGYQDVNLKGFELRARAVRRLIIEE